MAEYSATLNIEQRSIDYVPEELRHGSVRSLFTMWFGVNMQMNGVITGALAVVFGLSLPWAILSAIIGNLIGGLFMALHSAQGPKLGIPQMIQSRAQFGYYGAILPLVLVVLMYIGFYATGTVVGGEALSGLLGIGETGSIIIVGILSGLITVFGYRVIHRYAKWSSLLSGLAFAYLIIAMIGNNDVGAAWHSGGYATGPFILGITLVATYQITFAPYVADYSRYLPSSTSIRASFWWTYSGSVIGNLWMNVFGCIAAAVALDKFNASPVGFTVHQAGGALWIFYIIIVIGMLDTNVVNIYSTFMAAVTTVTAVSRTKVVGWVSRIIYIGIATAVGVVLADAGHDSFLNSYENFIIFLSYFVVPWTAVNLMDFYIVRRSNYNIMAVFDPHGEYGLFRWEGIAAYLIGVVVEIPFMNTEFYVGPAVKPMNGADISWIVGVIVAAVLYMVFMKRREGQPLAGGIAVPARTTHIDDVTTPPVGAEGSLG